MKYFIIVLVIYILSSCGRSGTNDRHITSTLQSCIITAEEVICGKTTFPVPPRESLCSEEVPPPADDSAPEVPVSTDDSTPEVPPPTEDLIIEEELEDLTAEVLDTPVVITYHGTICNNIPIVQLGNLLYVIYGSQLSLITTESAAVWEGENKKKEVIGCYVKLNGEGQVESQYINEDNKKKKKRDEQ